MILSATFHFKLHICIEMQLIDAYFFILRVPKHLLTKINQKTSPKSSTVAYETIAGTWQLRNTNIAAIFF